MLKKLFGLTLLILVFATPLFARSDQSNWCGTRGVELTKYFLKVHEKHQKDEALKGIAAQSVVRPHADVGEIAVMRSNSFNLIARNLFDLPGKKITFSRNPVGGYNVKVTGGVVAATQGNPITLSDDDFRRIGFTRGFNFPFYSATYTAVFLNSDGNLTFRNGDRASTPRDVLRVVGGSPRIAPFFEDLNPTLKGTIRVLQTPTKFSVTWNDISQFLDFGTNSNTFQVNLFKNGNIEFIYGSRMDTKSAVVGISQGNSTVSNLRLVNYSGVRSLTGVRTVILERFATSPNIDYTALVNEFHQTHEKIFDFVVIFTDFPVQLQGGEAFAFYSPVQNNIRGIGEQTFNFSRSFGSRKLQGMLVLGFAGEFPTDLNAEFFREYSTLELMAHEGAHRWLFRSNAILNGVRSKDLLGLQESHYSFYVDADASFMEGNNFVDNGNGSFTTNATSEIYNKLDLYLMGLIPAVQVPPFFIIGGFSDPIDKERFPQTGVTVNGLRVNVSLSQIIQADGPRVPSVATSQKSFRAAFILFTKNTNPSQPNLQKVDRIRTAYQTYFRTKTENKGTIDTTLP